MAKGPLDLKTCGHVGYRAPTMWAVKSCLVNKLFPPPAPCQPNQPQAPSSCSSLMVIIVASAGHPGRWHFSPLVAKSRVWVPHLSLISIWCLLVKMATSQVWHDQRERAHQPQANPEHAGSHSSWSLGFQVESKPFAKILILSQSSHASHQLCSTASRPLGHSCWWADQSSWPSSCPWGSMLHGTEYCKIWTFGN